MSDLPPEWSKIGEVTCDKNVLHDADVVLVPANDGFLWDLAWDHDFECRNSDMFKTFASLFVDKDATLDPLGCFISRQGRTIRTVLNLNETIGMMREIFPRVRVIHLTTDHTTDDTVDMLYECRVLFGIHGAGHMNAIFARPGVAVVEMLGNMGDKVIHHHTSGMSTCCLGNIMKALRAMQNTKCVRTLQWTWKKPVLHLKEPKIMLHYGLKNMESGDKDWSTK